MRYVQGGGLTPGEREQRDRLRAEAAERFTQGHQTDAIARELRVAAGRCGAGGVRGKKAQRIPASDPNRVHLRERDQPHEIARTTPHALADLLHVVQTGEFSR